MSIWMRLNTGRLFYGLKTKTISSTAQLSHNTEDQRINRKQPNLDVSKSQNTQGFTNEPIKFLGSQAELWRAKNTRSGGSEDSLWYQPYVISFSLAIFLIYFCILREESDIDNKLEGNLYDHVAGLEEVALSVNYKYNKEHGLDTKEQEQRLNELGVNIKQLQSNK